MENNSLKNISIDCLDLIKGGIADTFCEENAYYNIEQILRLSREELINEQLWELFEAIHSLNLSFKYELQYANILKKLMQTGAVLDAKYFYFLLDLFHSNYSYFFEIRNSLELMNRLELFVSLKKISSHDKTIFKNLFDINVEHIEKNLNNIRMKDSNLNLLISELNIPKSAKMSLCGLGGIKTLGDLILLSSSDLKKFRNIGNVSCEIIIKEVHSFGYKFTDELTNKDECIAIQKNKKVQLLNKYKKLTVKKEKLVEHEKKLDKQIEEVKKEINKVSEHKHTKIIK